jgi:glycosyltransferase involved in cell wall biosynthesis
VRVLLVGPYPFDPERVGGGVETSFMALLAALARLPDVEPHAATFVTGLRRPTRKDVDTVPVHFLPRIRRVGSLTLHLLERRALRRLLASLRPELIHAQDSSRHGFVSVKAARGTPVVVTIHGISRAELGLESELLARVRFLLAGAALERSVIRHARYFTQSTRYPEQYFGPELRGRIWEIANPIPDSFFAIEPAPEPGRVLYAGAVIPRKRLLDLVDAMASVRRSVPDARLAVAGGEPDPGYVRDVLARVRELGLESRVEFLGGLSPAAMVDQYRRASVFVLPSAQETSPLAIGEAMAAAVPVVATRVGGVASLVDEGRTGHVVDVGDVTTLAERIAGVLGDPTRASELGAAGRAVAERDFRLDVVSRRMRDAYQEVLLAESRVSAGREP